MHHQTYPQKESNLQWPFLSQHTIILSSINSPRQDKPEKAKNSKLLSKGELILVENHKTKVIIKHKSIRKESMTKWKGRCEGISTITNLQQPLCFVKFTSPHLFESALQNSLPRTLISVCCYCYCDWLNSPTRKKTTLLLLDWLKRLLKPPP